MQNRTRIKQELVIEQLKGNGGDVKLSCENTGVARSQYYEWLKKHPDFKNEVNIVYGNIEAFAKSNLYKRALNFNPEALRILIDKSKKKINNLND